jgi:hypothetical protein
MGTTVNLSNNVGIGDNGKSWRSRIALYQPVRSLMDGTASN